MSEAEPRSRFEQLYEQYRALPPNTRAEIIAGEILSRVGRYVEPEDNPISLVPDWICEVLSPSTARSDRVEKMPLYAEHGVGHLWLVDPVAETLEVLVCLNNALRKYEQCSGVNVDCEEAADNDCK